MLVLQMSIDVFQCESLRQHEHLKVVQELADFLSEGIVTLILSGHPHLGCFLDDFLTDRMNSGVQLRHRATTWRSRARFFAEFCEEGLKAFHGSSVPCLSDGVHRARAVRRRPVTP